MTSQQLKAVTRCDLVLSKVLLYSKTGWPVTVPELLKPYWKRRLEISIEDECLMSGTHEGCSSKLHVVARS